MKFKYKLIVVVDQELQMPKGKLAREVAGAVTKTIFHHILKFKWLSLYQWYKGGQKTVVLKTMELKPLIALHREMGSKFFEMWDAGLTVFNWETLTAISFPIMKNNDERFDDFKLL